MKLPLAPATILSALLAGGPALACSLPMPICEVAGGQIATLEGVEGATVMFSQRDADSSRYEPTFVLVDCRTRQAVALGHLPEEAAPPAFDTHLKGRNLMSEAVFAGARPRLGRVHRQLQALGLRSKRFTLLPDHCGCELPAMPPPPVACPDY